MSQTFLVITSIAKDDNPILQQYAKDCSEHKIPFIVIGDTKSPDEFKLEGCDFYSINDQKATNYELAKVLPVKHYARKNLGYLIAISKGAKIIIETDDDNWPLKGFWTKRQRHLNAHLLLNNEWVNVYKYFSKNHIWPRGFALENLLLPLPLLQSDTTTIECPIQQGLADENPDVDAIYRLTLPLPFVFDKGPNIALGENSICPFNSQNTTWFQETFPLLYLPSYCSFRMTDIWRSFVAQRIAWTCGWPILFHESTVWQQRNDHNLMNDFRDEISGYNNNLLIGQSLKELDLKQGVVNINSNMKMCYQKLIDLNLIGIHELVLLDAWLLDIDNLLIG